MMIRYLIKTLLLPPCSLLLVMLAAWLFRKRWPRRAATGFLLSFITLWAISTPQGASRLAVSIEQHPALTPEMLTTLPAQAIVILSARQQESFAEFGEPVSDLSQLARLRYGAFLAKQTGLPVLLTGGSALGYDDRSGAETMAYDLQAYGVRASWLETLSRTTAENAGNSYRLLAPEGVTTILLVTSADHMMRANWLFTRAGFTVIPAPTMFAERPPASVLSFLPQAGGLETSSRAIHEWLGYWSYRLGDMVGLGGSGG